MRPPAAAETAMEEHVVLAAEETRCTRVADETSLGQ
jgi:hypothetical protein